MVTLFGKNISAVVIKLRISSYNHRGLLLNPKQVSLQEKGRGRKLTQKRRPGGVRSRVWQPRKHWEPQEVGRHGHGLSSRASIGLIQPYRHLGFGLQTYRTVKKLIPVVLSHLLWDSLLWYTQVTNVSTLNTACKSQF